MKFETVRIHFLSDVFGFLSSKNFATMATWRNDFSSVIVRKRTWIVYKKIGSNDFNKSPRRYNICN